MDKTNNESILYGKAWNSAHHGYFSDSGIATPLVEAVMEACHQDNPDVIADLGGGTGVVLKMLLTVCESVASRLLVVDVSGKQLQQVCDERIICVESPVEKLDRQLLTEGDGRLLIYMRSLLHYFGKDGLGGILRHLRSLLLEGEHLIHQTACFENADQCGIANEIYGRIGTGKWYPTVAELVAALGEEGFDTKKIRQVQSLVLPGSELRERYNVDEKEMDRLARELIEKYEPHPGVFEYNGSNFTLFLNYHVLTCSAV